MTGRADCEYKILSWDFNEHRAIATPCGQLAVDKLQCAQGLLWLCADHFDYMTKIKERAKKMAQDYRDKYGKSKYENFSS